MRANISSLQRTRSTMYAQAMMVLPRFTSYPHRPFLSWVLYMVCSQSTATICHGWRIRLVFTRGSVGSNPRLAQASLYRRCWAVTVFRNRWNCRKSTDTSGASLTTSLRIWARSARACWFLFYWSWLLSGGWWSMGKSLPRNKSCSCLVQRAKV